MQASADDGAGQALQRRSPIYRHKPFDGLGKDPTFGRAEMRAHWRGGLDDMHRTLDHPDWFAQPGAERGHVAHDVHTQA